MTCTREGCRGRKHIKAAWNFVSCQGLDSCVFEATFAIPGLALKGLRPALKLYLHQTVCKYVSRKVLRATFWGEIVVGMFDPMKYMKSGGKAIKPGVQGMGEALCSCFGPFGESLFTPCPGLVVQVSKVICAA